MKRDHQNLAQELVKVAFDELSHGLPASDEGKLYMAATLTGKFMATIEWWERGEEPVIVEGTKIDQVYSFLPMPEVPKEAFDFLNYVQERAETLSGGGKLEE